MASVSSQSHKRFLWDLSSSELPTLRKNVQRSSAKGHHYHAGLLPLPHHLGHATHGHQPISQHGRRPWRIRMPPGVRRRRSRQRLPPGREAQVLRSRTPGTFGYADGGEGAHIRGGFYCLPLLIILHKLHINKLFFLIGLQCLDGIKASIKLQAMNESITEIPVEEQARICFVTIDIDFTQKSSGEFLLDYGDIQ